MIESDAVAAELVSHNRPEIKDSLQSPFETLVAADIAEAIAYMVTLRRRPTVNDVWASLTEQSFWSRSPDRWGLRSGHAAP